MDTPTADAALKYNCYAKGRNQNQMNETDINAILSAYRSTKTHEGAESVQVRQALHSEIKENGWDLT
jgi:type I restriction-modification system DNA methylase subunit